MLEEDEIEIIFEIVRKGKRRKLAKPVVSAFISLCPLPAFCRYIVLALLLYRSVCRSCIVMNLQDSEENICPKCSTVIHETNPFEMLR